MLYRRKNVYKYEAVQWNGNNLDEIKEFVGKAYCSKRGYDDCIILNDEIPHWLYLRGYVVKSSTGWLWTYKEEEFEQKFEEVRENNELCFLTKILGKIR